MVTCLSYFLGFSYQQEATYLVPRGRVWSFGRIIKQSAAATDVVIKKKQFTKRSRCWLTIVAGLNLRRSVITLTDRFAAPDAFLKLAEYKCASFSYE